MEIEIEFRLSKQDILALAKHRQEHSPTLQRRFNRIRYSYLIGFGLMGIGSFIISKGVLSFAFSASSTFLASSISFFIASIVSFLLYPAFNAWRIKNSVLRAYQNETDREKLGVGKRILRATNEGLVEISPIGEIKVKWTAIDNISVTPTHAFISIEQMPITIIPKDKVKENFHEFIKVCQKFQGDNSN